MYRFFFGESGIFHSIKTKIFRVKGNLFLQRLIPELFPDYQKRIISTAPVKPKNISHSWFRETSGFSEISSFNCEVCSDYKPCVKTCLKFWFIDKAPLSSRSIQEVQLYTYKLVPKRAPIFYPKVSSNWSLRVSTHCICPKVGTDATVQKTNIQSIIPKPNGGWNCSTNHSS